MKRIITLVLVLFISTCVFAQTEGISYQAVIIGPDDLELPGVDSEGNYLPTTEIDLRFTILIPGADTVLFTEIQTTTTDEFGRINLIIGDVEFDKFSKIDWSKGRKSLKVEVDFKNGDGYVDMGIEKLTYVPYVTHRNITASGTLEVDDNTTLRGELTVVDKPTTLGGTFNVIGQNRSNLSGELNVDGETNLNNTLNVTGLSVTNLSGALNVGDPSVGPPDGDPNAPTILNGSLTVVGESTFTGLVADELTINESTELNGSVDINSDAQITITSTLDEDDDTDINSYPLKIEGGQQGIAIVVNESRTNDNNFISFWDNTSTASPARSGEDVTTTNPTMWGRIEGETPGEFDRNADYVFDQNSLGYDIYDADLDLAWATIDIVIEGFDLAAAYTDFRPCLGFGACTTSPGLADIAASVASVALVITKEVFAIRGKIRADNNKETYDNNKLQFQGVTYASGAGDYAEYLLRENLSEAISYGDVVGVVGGKVSKNTEHAKKVMVVSRKPIVLGNMPHPNKEADYEKVAFMGQVPVKVYGKVSIGDYIVASGKNDGIGIAVKPTNINTRLVKKIVGIAWEESNSNTSFSLVNVAVGLNVNDNNPIVEKLEQKLSNQELVINMLKAQMSDIINRFEKLEHTATASSNTIASTNGESSKKDYHDDRRYEIIETPLGEVAYFEMKDEDFEQGLKMAEAQLIAEGIDLSDNEFWQNLKNNPEFKNTLKDKLTSKFHHQLHYHKQVSKSKQH